MRAPERRRASQKPRSSDPDRESRRAAQHSGALAITEKIMNRIIQGIQRFQKHVYPRNRDLFQRLASGQSPEALFIACSDSRISLDLITQTAPGDLFVCRNAGSIVPAHGQSDAISAAIEYAVSVLGVNHIVVCGHSDCGAMKGLLHPESVEGLPEVKQWLRHAEGARCALERDYAGMPQAEALTLLTKLNIRLQLDHLRTHPLVFARLQDHSLQLHGWFYHIGSGDVQVWEADQRRWAQFEEAAPFIAAGAPAVASGAQNA
jgi:carbonic anhydrase